MILNTIANPYCIGRCSLRKYDKEFQEMVTIANECDGKEIAQEIVSAKKVVEVCKSELGISKQSKFWKIMNQLGIIL